MPRVQVIAFAALLLAPLLALGCRSPGAARIVGPDGSAMAHVHCGRDQAACFRLAGGLCPTGYEMKPVLTGQDGNFLLRCRDAGQSRLSACPAPAAVEAPALTTPAAPRAAAPVAFVTPRAARPSSPNDVWPPAAEPWSAELLYPWPPAAANATAQPNPPTPQGDGGQVDIGY